MAAEILLTFANKIINKEVIAGAVSLVEFFKRNPEWLNDSYIIEAKISVDSREQAIILFDFIRQKMQTHNYANNDIEKFGVIYHEITNNVFDHGCVAGSDVATINIQVAASISILIAINPRGRTWDVQSALTNAALRVNHGGHHGRGLLLVKHLAGELASYHSNQGIKVVFAKTGNSLTYLERSQILEIDIYTRGNISEHHFELFGIIENSVCKKVIISIIGYANSSTLGIIISIYHRCFQNHDRTLALCVNSDVLEFFEICGLSQQLAVQTTIDEARAFVNANVKA
jgi:anti-anti-sigma factor